jgi:hypothetical protein
VVPSHRSTKGYDFYELKCLGCGNSYKLGERKDHRLFPKGPWEPSRYGNSQETPGGSHQAATGQPGW